MTTDDYHETWARYGQRGRLAHYFRVSPYRQGQDPKFQSYRAACGVTASRHWMYPMSESRTRCQRCMERTRGKQ